MSAIGRIRHRGEFTGWSTPVSRRIDRHEFVQGADACPICTTKTSLNECCTASGVWSVAEVHSVSRRQHLHGMSPVASGQLLPEANGAGNVCVQNAPSVAEQ